MLRRLGFADDDFGDGGHVDTDMTDLTVSTTAHGKTMISVIHTTQRHPFFDRTVRNWRYAGELRVGDKLAGAGGSAQTVAEVLGVRSYQLNRLMLDLTIRQAHTFFVTVGPFSALVHNCSLASTARTAAREAPEDATMTSAARFRGTNMTEVGYSGPSSRPAYLEPEISENIQHGGQMYQGDATNCAEIRACNSLIANHGSEFEEITGRRSSFRMWSSLQFESQTAGLNQPVYPVRVSLFETGRPTYRDGDVDG